MTAGWPEDWEARINGTRCEMCNSTRPDEDKFGIRIYASDLTDAVLQRANIQRGRRPFPLLPQDGTESPCSE